VPKARVPGKAGRIYYWLSITQFIFFICVVHSAAQYSEIPISENIQQLQAKIVQKLQQDVDYLNENLIDFISSEELTIEAEFDTNGKPRITKSIISEYRVIPRIIKAGKTLTCKLVYDVLSDSAEPVDFLREERNMKSGGFLGLPSYAAGQDQHIFNVPFYAGGSSYSGFFVLFDKQYENCFDFKLVGAGKIMERDVYAMAINQKDNEIGDNSNTVSSINMTWYLGYNGVAWIDKDTMDIIQLNRMPVGITYGPTPPRPSKTSRTPPPDNQYIFTNEYEYDKVHIKDKYFTLPVTRTINLFYWKVPDPKTIMGGLKNLFQPTKKDWQLTAAFKYVYSDYRAFNVNTTITFSPMEE